MSSRPAIAMPVRNGSHRLEPAIDRLLAQNPTPTICVLDDHSHDATPYVLERLAQKHSEVQVRRTETRVGPVEAFRRSAALARQLRSDAELFAWVSADDLPDPEWLGRLADAMRRRRERVAALPDEPAPPLAMRGLTDPARRAALALDREWPLLPTGILFRLDDVLAAGGLRSVANPAGVLAAELALEGELVTIDQAGYERGKWSRSGLTDAYPNGIPVMAVLPARAAALLTLSRYHHVGGAVLRDQLRRPIRRAGAAASRAPAGARSARTPR